MFCNKCGKEVPEGGKFCNHCGAQLNQQPQQPPVQALNSGKSQAKKSTLKWVIPFIIFDIILIGCLVFIVYLSGEQRQAEKAALDYVDEHYCSTFAEEADSVEKISNNRYTVIYNIDKDYNLWQMTGSIEMLVYKEDDEWVVEVEKENVNYNFKENDNWYYITANRNRKFLIKIIELNQNEVKLEYYSYAMGSYNTADDFEHDTTYCDVKYDGASQSFTFSFMGDWRIYGHYVGFNRFEVGPNYNYEQYSEDFQTLQPVNPEDYWWYEKAKG